MKTGSSNPQQDRILFVGTTEIIAKSATVKGLQPPVILTEVFPAYFCHKESGKSLKWGIISVNASLLHEGMFAPFQGTGRAWRFSLQKTGLCRYKNVIPPSAIARVMIYTPFGEDTNEIINEFASSQDIDGKYKDNFQFNKGLTRWLNGEEIQYKDIFSNLTRFGEVEEKLLNRSGLELFYVK